MTLDEAVAEFESALTVHDVIGLPINAGYDGPADMTRAPSGERYITLTSGGLKREGAPISVWLASEDDAIDWWLMEAKHYAESQGTQLYWRSKPELMTQTFVAVNQAAAIQDERLRDTMSVELSFVWSRLLVSRKDPSGKEIG